MKKCLSLILVLILILGLSACRKKDSVSSFSSQQDETVESLVQDTTAPESSKPEESSQLEEPSEPENSSKTEDPQPAKSTITTPYEVRFYKNGMETISTDKELNLRVAKHIEAWYDGCDSIAATDLAADTDLIRDLRRNQMAIEFNFDSEINDRNGVFYKNTRTLFIPLTGEYKYLIFSNSIASPDYWGGPKVGGDGLEKFFDEVAFTPLTEEEIRWRSTVSTPSAIEFYSDGKFIGESRDMKGYALNHEIAQQIESWFYKKDDISTETVNEMPIEIAWGNDDYIWLKFNYAPTFYGEQIIDINYTDIVIPLTGEYAYYMFLGTYKEMTGNAICVGGSGLETFLENFILKNAES